MSEHETQIGEYMYCIIRCPQPRQFMTRGIGERGDIVYTIPFDDLAAVVSDSPPTGQDEQHHRARDATTAHVSPFRARG